MAVDRREARKPAWTENVSSWNPAQRFACMPGSTPALGRLILDGRLLLYAGAGPIDSVPLWIGQAGGLRKTWRFQDEAGAILSTQAISESDRARLGFPKDGLAIEIRVTVSRHDRKSGDLSCGVLVE